MAAARTLVIGSTKHQHVQCIDWQDINSVNILDFEKVVLNTRSLRPAVITKLSTYARNIRISLARLLYSGGDIVILGAARISVNLSHTITLDNYFWSPVNIQIVAEAGETIDRLTSQFNRYLSRFVRWGFYYSFPNNATSEMTEVFGNPRVYQYERFFDVFARNRYGEMLSGALYFTIADNRGTGTNTGSVILLPHLEDVDYRQAVNLALEDLLELPQETLPPEWADTVAMPLVGELRAEIEERQNTIACVEKEIDDRAAKIVGLEVFKKLLYVGGHELESLFERCLTECGGITNPPRYSDEEFVLEYKREVYLIECKGVGKSIARSHVVQLLGYLAKFEETEGRSGKGILLGNAWKDLPVNERGQKDSVIFPDNVIKSAASNGIALVSSVDFFNVFCRFLAGEVAGGSILDYITEAVGVVSFLDL